ncbi:winged helix-turn-helix transcriptional regulator [Natrinema sp. CGMCC1.2065]|uniref:winged helix-turn-helix transcriptional regulator n=1 Tax=Natrinema sp. CGMCC1.2065 TaxID=3445767 RepID=UPI003F49BFC0
MALDRSDLNGADKAIIAALREGRNIPSNLADELDYSREYVSSRLKRLREHDIVENIGGGVYELIEENVPTEE